MRELTQDNAPIFEALERFKHMRVVPLTCRDTNGEGEIQN